MHRRSAVHSRWRRPLLLLSAGALAAAGLIAPLPAAAATANPVPGDPLTGNGAVSRTLLPYSQLTNPQNPSGPVDDAAFALPAAAAPPRSTFEGTLTLTNPAGSGRFKNIKSCSTGCGKHLPPISLDLVQNGSHLIPTVQGLTITGDTQSGSTYNLIVGPGRAWSENGDTGTAGTFSRASLPIALVDRNQNCVHNGELSFLYNTTSVSNVAYQVTAETCALHQFDMWGQLAATYNAHSVPNAVALENAHAAEVGNRMPTKPLSALATDYPTAGLNLATFGSGITPSAMTSYGVVYNGVNYVAGGTSANKGCQTRYGTYAFCQDMRLPSYSTAKSAFAGLSMARLVQDFGSAVPNLDLKDYVPEMASSGNWNSAQVTFNNAADMATGNFNSQLYESDENGANTTSFLNAEPYGTATTGKMGYALGYAHHAGEQGNTWAYHSVDHFLLAQAETGYLQSQRGPSADLFNLMRDEVYTPLHLNAGTLTTERTDNASAAGTSPTTGRLFAAYGLFWTVDDIAKLATLFQNNGAAGGTQLADRGQMLTAMQRSSTDTGVAAVSADLTGHGDGTAASGGYRYSNGLWAYPTTGQVPGCGLRVPFMSGYGGITIAMMPNGATYYYVSDNNEFGWASTVAELNKLSPMCAPTTTTVTASPAAVTAGQPVTLTASVGAATRSWAATGTVQFQDNGLNLGTPVALDSTGNASYTTNSLGSGPHSITAVYAPDLSNDTGTASSPFRTTLTSSCSTTATTCKVASTAGLKVGDTIGMGSATLTDDTHVITALTPTSITWVGAYQQAGHSSGQAVWLQNTAGGGFAASTSAGVGVTVS
ncbi:Ig-like domain repeat protein [Kitasatospora cineracea]|uniref:Ig-like domain-containing protein n=1 Tax=Kitasatospora cineracea TaxID=88074 RepID=A0A3N4RKX8_9ACTN|nr:Ig-like domain repeat protein [Kitasatospora cineracea]RPE31839.1 Ig-like domain-containing protein [Kitasatospora cineracea]